MASLFIHAPICQSNLLPKLLSISEAMSSTARSVTWFLGMWWSELTEENTKITLSLTSVGFSIHPVTWFAFIWELLSPEREPGPPKDDRLASNAMFPAQILNIWKGSCYVAQIGVEPMILLLLSPIF